MTQIQQNNVISIRVLNRSDFSEVSSLIRSQNETIPREYFFPPSSEILISSLESGLSLGVFNKSQLVGFRLTYVPNMEIDNHGYDLDFSEGELKRVAQFHGTLIVQPKRYQGLGSYLVNMNLPIIYKYKKDAIVLATVHPDNLNSCKMLISNGFSACKTVMKYNNLPRIIFKHQFNEQTFY